MRTASGAVADARSGTADGEGSSISNNPSASLVTTPPCHRPADFLERPMAVGGAWDDARVEGRGR
jgi:hypothetical protein